MTETSTKTATHDISLSREQSVCNAIAAEQYHFLDCLVSAVWLYDIENYHIIWANKAALSLWESEDLAELVSRDFKPGSSDAVQQTLIDYQQIFKTGKSLSRVWRYSPKGILKEVYCQMSGYPLPDGRIGLLTEAITVDLIDNNKNASSVITLSTYHLDGSFISGNPPFLETQSPDYQHLESLFVSKQDYQKVRNIIDHTGRFEDDIQIFVNQQILWHRLIVSYSEQDNIDTTLLVQQFNIDERKRKELALEKDVITDPLTGLLNRRGLNNAVGQKDSFVIFYLDLDGFKLINDSLGHAVGDQVLQHLAAKLTGSELKHGLACRFGGDEFIWLVDEDKLTTSIEATANLLFQVMNEPFLDNEGRPIKISASVGIANYPADGNDFNELILKADAAMYLAKKQGKHRWVNYISGMENTLQRHSMLAQYLYKALDNNEFSLHYQPIINTKTNTVDSLEALLRWHNPEIGPVPADECIKVAEEIGVIVALEQWVIATAIADIKDFQKVFDKQIKVAINVSSHFLANSASIDFIVQQLAVNQQNISSINIELTESALLANLSHENNMAQQFNQQGIALSIDDFGTGFSSLAYLDQIPAKYIKIDRSFTNKIECDSTMLIGIQHLIQSLGFNTIVEGVETLQQAQILQEIGIELMQGYGLARPQPLSYYQQTCNLANLVLKI